MKNKNKLLQKQIDEIERLKKLKRFSPEFKAWERKTKSLLSKIFGEKSSQVEDFAGISYMSQIITPGTPDRVYQEDYIEGLEDAKAILNSMIEELTEFDLDENTDKDNPYLFVLTLLNNFHNIVRQLRNRHEKRVTLNVRDEYDAQDLIHALLKVRFEDVRAEEWTPSYAGKSARMDFLIKETGIVVEVKKTRDTLKEKEIGDQLIVDIERYKNHPDCKKLICFVYDPEGLIGNPTGLSRDLSREGDDFSVKVIVKP